MAVKDDDFDKAIRYLEKLYESEKSSEAYNNVESSSDTSLRSTNSRFGPTADLRS